MYIVLSTALYLTNRIPFAFRTPIHTSSLIGWAGLVWLHIRVSHYARPRGGNEVPGTQEIYLYDDGVCPLMKRDVSCVTYNPPMYNRSRIDTWKLGG